MTIPLQRLLHGLAAFLLVAMSAGAHAASQFYLTLSGTPNGITCTNTGFTLGNGLLSGLTASWNFKPGSAQMVDGTSYVNGGPLNTTSSSLSAYASPQPLPTVASAPFASTPFPYTVEYRVVPQDTDTDGVAVAFTCGASGYSNFRITTLPGRSAVLQASPSSMNFGSVPVGTTSAATTFTVTNNGAADASGVSVSANLGDFLVSANMCSGTLAVGASCTFAGSFAPQAGGPRNGSFVVQRQYGTGVNISASGTGLVSLTMPPPLAFASQAVGTTSAASVVTVTNASATTVNVSAVTSSNPTEFPLTTNCAAVAAGATCTISISFKPSDTGTRQATITVTSDGIGSPQTFTATGTGTPGAPPPGQLTVPASTTFGSVAVGATSAGNTLTLTNTGGTAVTIASVTSSAPAEFTITANACTTVAAGASCSITVTFSPTTTGARSATLTVTSNGVGSPQAIAASGTGTAAASGVLSVPTSLEFPAQNVGTTSAPTAVTITNTGNSPVTVSGVALTNTSEFAIVSNSCGVVAAGASCTVSLTFTPAQAGARSGSLTIASNGTGSPQAVALTGSGVAQAGPGVLSFVTSVDFGTVVLGATSAPQTLVVTNIGGTAVQVSSVASSQPGEFAVTSSTCGTVAPGAACSVSLTFAPASAGERTAALTITSNGAGSPQAAALRGVGSTGQPATVDVIEYYHAAWDHYFVTAIADEIAKLDAGVFVGWARTGLEFKAYAANTAGSANVCRFFSTSFGERSSHFYTPFVTECSIVKQNPNWMLESESVFAIPVPDLAGNCAAGTTPVYRYYNDGQGNAPNHRYTIDPALRNVMLQRGWISEGYGDLGVIMCSPL